MCFVFENGANAEEIFGHGQILVVGVFVVDKRKQEKKILYNSL